MDWNDSAFAACVIDCYPSSSSSCSCSCIHAPAHHSAIPTLPSSNDAMDANAAGSDDINELLALCRSIVSAYQHTSCQARSLFVLMKEHSKAFKISYKNAIFAAEVVL
jgi:hypothetical protein